MMPGATHFRLMMAGLSWNIKDNKKNVCDDQSRWILFDKDETGDFVLNGTVKPYRDRRMLPGLGIQYAQEINEDKYTLVQGGAFGIVEAG